jgi:hypothetical protein
MVRFAELIVTLFAPRFPIEAGINIKDWLI